MAVLQKLTLLSRFERQLKYHGRYSIKSNVRYCILCKVQGQAGNERCPSDYHEEWQARHAGDLRCLRD